MTQRITDQNGFFEVKANPLSRVGVFPYSGRQLGFSDERASKIFQVYRPAEELADPACLASFRLMPLVDDHTVIGPTAVALDPDNALPAEQKGVHGVIGEEVYFQNGWLYGNIKIFSSVLQRLIEAGKKQLSAGYACVYEMTAGLFEGQPYDAIQRSIRGNHVALVNEGRMGPQVAVLDHLSFTFDAKEAVMADKENAPGGESSQGGMSLEEVAKTLQTIVPQIAKIQEMLGGLSAVKSAVDPLGGEDDKDGTPAATAKTEEPAAVAAMDAKLKEATKTIAAMDAKITALEEAAKTNTPAAFMVGLDQRDALVERLKPFIGVFDAKEKTTEQVAAYALDKLGVKNVPQGGAAAAVDVWLHGRAAPVDGPRVTVATDAADKTGAVDTWIKGA